MTGASGGIGRATALELAERGARLILASRSSDRIRPVLDAIEAAGAEARFVPLDLASLAEVRRAADAVLSEDEALSLLVCNAGTRGRGTTVDGFDLAFGVNHLGHHLLTRLLLPKLEESAPARVVVVASDAHYGAKGVDWDRVRRRTASFTGLPEYGVSKLCNVLFTRELHRRCSAGGIGAYAVHPGVVSTGMWRPLPQPFRRLVTRRLRTPEEGARTSVYCAAAPLPGPSGAYYADERVKEPSRVALDDALALELWERSDAWVEPFLSP